MQWLMKWWRGRTWTYIGHTEFKGGDGESDVVVVVVHFFVWENDNKKRRAEIVNIHKRYYVDSKNWPWWHKNVVPWLNGADMWKPVATKIATKGTLIDYVGNQP